MNILYAVIPERLTIKGALAAVVLALQTRPALAVSYTHLTLPTIYSV